VTYPAALPITARRDEIVAAIRAGRPRVLIVSGETGCGKSTQLPKMCLEAGRGRAGRIGVTQPRRIAAVTIAARIAEELGVPSVPGAGGARCQSPVGYKIRFQDRVPPGALIKVMTDGIMLAETQRDPLLLEYDTIIIDEAHERTLNIDFLLGICRRLLDVRTDLRLIITSATLDTEKFSRAFGNAPVIEVSGRLYPVEVEYREKGRAVPAPGPGNTDREVGSGRGRAGRVHADRGRADRSRGDHPPGGGRAAAAPAWAGRESDTDYIDAAVEAVDHIKRRRPPGDILVFMPTEQDILETCRVLEGRRYPLTTVLPLFSRLPAGEQRRVYTVTTPKVVVATNVAETSLTIPGIRYVVDTGLARIARYQPDTRIKSLPISPVSRASADQRKGRCGRVRDGVCVRLYSEADYESRDEFMPPEILRSDLAEVILRMLDLNLGDPLAFPFIDKPAARAVRDGYETLLELGAIRRAAPATSPAPAPQTAANRHQAPPLPGTGRGGGPAAGGPVGSPGRDRPDSSGTRPTLAAQAAPTAAGRGSWELTPLGRLMARMPIDPRLGRMLIEAARENALPEVIVIAAGLSIRDPRERPAGQSTQADAAQAVFRHPSSDFLTLLKLWRAFNSPELATSARKRRFCEEHFLSYTRMREWNYLVDEIRSVIKESERYLVPKVPGAGFARVVPHADISPALYAAVHRSILSGYLSNIAVAKEDAREKNVYQAARNREVTLWPGSVLYGKSAPWVVATEVVRTSRLFARMAASIDPAWLEELGAGLCKRSYSDPAWDPERGEVVAKERVTLFGLEIVLDRRVSYGRIAPDEAHRVFVMSALVEGRLMPGSGKQPAEAESAGEPGAGEGVASGMGAQRNAQTRPRAQAETDDEADRQAFARGSRRLLTPSVPGTNGTWYRRCQVPVSDDMPAFLRHNLELQRRLETLEEKLRRRDLLFPEEKLAEFYSARLPGIRDRRSLFKLLKDRGGDDSFLRLSESDLLRTTPEPELLSGHPDELEIAGRRYSAEYRFAPGEEDDGVTLHVPVPHLPAVPPARLSWGVPARAPELIASLVRNLPKRCRKLFLPLSEKVEAIVREMPAADEETPLVRAVAEFARRRFGADIPLRVWSEAEAALPKHLRLRVAAVDPETGRVIESGRDIELLRRKIGAADQAPSKVESPAWKEAAARWEKSGLTGWSFGDLPEEVPVGATLKGYPALVAGEAWAAEAENAVENALAANGGHAPKGTGAEGAGTRYSRYQMPPVPGSECRTPAASEVAAPRSDTKAPASVPLKEALPGETVAALEKLKARASAGEKTLAASGGQAPKETGTECRKPGEAAAGPSADLSIRLFPTRAEAEASHRRAVRLLLQWKFARDLAFFLRSYRIPAEYDAASRPLGGRESLERSLASALSRALFERDIRTEAEFNALSSEAPRRLFERGQTLLDAVLRAVKLAHSLRGELGQTGTGTAGDRHQRHRSPVSETTRAHDLGSLSRLKKAAVSPAYLDEVREDLERLLPPNFLDFYPYERVLQLPRYLEAVKVRLERARIDPEKDRAKSEQVQPFALELARLERELARVAGREDGQRSGGEAVRFRYQVPRQNGGQAPKGTGTEGVCPPCLAVLLDELRWMIEEFKVSLFAPEIKAAFPISAVRLARKVKQIDELLVPDRLGQ
jgi:ATP-dependent helicase HrpA